MYRIPVVVLSALPAPTFHPGNPSTNHDHPSRGPAVTHHVLRRSLRSVLSGAYSTRSNRQPDEARDEAVAGLSTGRAIA